MAVNRLDQNKDGADKAEKPQAPAPAPAAAPAASASGGMKAWLPLIVTVVLMPVLAYAITNYVLLPKLQKGLGLNPASLASHAPKTDAKHGKEPEAKKETATMGKLLVNLTGTMGSRYLMTSLTLVGTGVDFKSRIDKNDPQLRDAAGTVLSAKTLADLERPGARNLVRSELIAAFNNVLGGSVVQEIYLTEFAVQ